jgi:hypothetical protein
MNEKYLQTVLLLLFFSSLHSRPMSKYINHLNEKANKMKVLFTIAIALATLCLAISPATAARTQRGRRLKKEGDPKPPKETVPPRPTETPLPDTETPRPDTETPRPDTETPSLPACKGAHYADTEADKCWNLQDEKDGAVVKDGSCYEKTDWIAYAGGGCYGKKEECDCNT